MTARRIAAALLLALAASPAAGESALEPPELSRYLRWGPLRARPGLELANAGYDDNILTSSSNMVPDYTATVFAKLDGLMLFGSRAFLVFDERFGYQAYLENPDQNFPIQRGNARVTFPIERFGVFAEVRYVRDTEQPVDVQDLRPERAEDRLGAGVILEPGWRTSVELSANATRWRYSDPDVTLLGGETVDERLDRDETFARLRARYRWRGRTALVADANTGSITFSHLDPLGRNKDSDAWSMKVGFDLESGGTLTGGAELGWQTVDAIDPTLADFDGVVGEADLAYRPLGRTTFRLEAERLPGFGLSAGSTYYLDTHANLSALYFLNRIVGVEVGAGLGTLTFPGSIIAGKRTDDTERRHLAVVLRLAEDSIGRRVEYRLDLERYERTSVVPSSNLTRTTLGFSAAVGF